MLFKIGTTTEVDGNVCVIAVPATWVSDRILFWPKHLGYFRISRLRKDPASVPDKNVWIKQKFTLTATANAYSVATKLESILLPIDETEDEEAHINLKQAEVQQTEKPVQLIDGPSSSSPHGSLISPVTLDIKTESGQCTTAESESEYIAADLASSKAGLTLNQDAKLNECVGKIPHCMQSNADLHLKVDNLQKTLNLILHKIDCLAAVSSPLEVAGEDSPEKSFQFPITSTEDLCELDRQLMQNPQLEASLIAKFTLIAGDSGRKTATKVGLKVVESIISPHLLIKYTWTGRSSAEKCTKLAFMKHCSVFSLCQKVISKADNRFNKEDCEIFFKNNVLKHSSMRLARKRKSCGTDVSIDQDATSNGTIQRLDDDLSCSEAKRQDMK